MNETNYADINAKTIDKWVDNGWEWGVPISHDDYLSARNGTWSVLLSPQKPVPKNWFAPLLRDGRLDGVKLLGLAAGGAQQMPVFAALGAICTVLDYSDRQIESERAFSLREGYEIDIIKADMSKPLPFLDGNFDLIFHPVSNCYVEDVQHVWNECFRILKTGGVLLAGMDNGINYLFDDGAPLRIVNKLPYNPLKDPCLLKKSAGSGVQFSHTMEEQIGGQLKAGFTLTDLHEDSDKPQAGKPGICEYYPQYVATRAVKKQREK